MKMKRILSLLLALVMVFALAACGSTDTPAPGTSGGDVNNPPEDIELTATQQIIQEAQGMTMEELAAKAIEESNGKTFYGLGNSSRGATALPLFIEYLQTIDPSYNMTYEWQQPKNNKIFDQLTSDSLKDVGTFAMTLIQDGNQIESKNGTDRYPQHLHPEGVGGGQQHHRRGVRGLSPASDPEQGLYVQQHRRQTYDNVWDFVGEGEHGLYMDIDSELVGKNFLYMLTEDTYATMLKDAFDALSADEQAYFQPTIDEMESQASDLGLGENGKYALAWIKLWVGSYKRPDRRRPHLQHPGDASATDQFGLLVYSKLRSVEESATVSKNNITVAAYKRRTTPASAALATATTCSSPRTARCPGPPAPSSPT